MPRIEGRNAVRETLRAGVPVTRVIVAEGLKPDAVVDEIIRMAEQRGAAVSLMRREDLDRLSDRGAHQGVIAETEAFRFASLDLVLDDVEGWPRALVIALDHVTDPGNLGAVVRSAEIAGASAVLVPGRRSAAITPAAYKAAAGALAYLPIIRETNLVRALGRFKEAGFWVAGADPHAEQTAWQAPMDGRLVIVLGSEGTGLSRLAREACDFLVGLPRAGRIESLNVAQAASVLAYEWVRRGETT